MADAWSFSFRPSDALPPLAWLARIAHPRIVVDCGLSVRTAEQCFVAGTWVGPPEPERIGDSTTVFGSAMVTRGDELLVVSAGHPLEGVYVWHRGDVTLASNSLVAILSAADLDLPPGVDYVSRFRRISDGVGCSPIEIPTSAEPVFMYFYDNVEIDVDGTHRAQPKPRERSFASYQEYAHRLERALGSAIANAPDYRPVVSLSRGYDSTAVAVLAARQGVSDVLTFAAARVPPGSADPSDSGAQTAAVLGMHAKEFDRLAYLSRRDLPEAEFLAAGMTGEDVVMSAMETDLSRSLLITGMVGGALWRVGRPERDDLFRTDLSGCSLAEFCIRLDTIHVALPIFGMSELPSVQALVHQPDMKPFWVSGFYNQPVPRRIAEEAGVRRGSFATVKRAATSVIHLDGGALLAPATRRSIDAFARAHGEPFELTPRRRLGRRHRLLIHVGRRLRLPALARPIERRRSELTHFEPVVGALLLRWATAQLRTRYSSLTATDVPSPEPVAAAGPIGSRH